MTISSLHDFSYLTFVTGNKSKAQEVQALLPGIKVLDVDLPELQELDCKKIIQAKVRAAFEHTNGPLIVDDGGLYLDCLGGQLPGPLIKWFLKTINNIGLVNIADRLGNHGAHATSIIGYAYSPDHIEFFEGSMRGTLVAPQEPKTIGFGWDAIFVPDGYSTTFANFDIPTKNSMSMRFQAITKLKEFLALESAHIQIAPSKMAQPK